MKFEEKAVNYLQFDHYICQSGNDSLTVVIRQGKNRRNSHRMEHKRYWLGISFDESGSIEGSPINFLTDVTVDAACIGAYNLLRVLCQLNYKSIGKIGVRFDADSDEMIVKLKNHFLQSVEWSEMFEHEESNTHRIFQK